MQNPILSIIIPVYNAEKYLEGCLQLLLAQSLCENEYEIILVNDGSTDGSQAIIDRYQTTHQNITSIIKANGGASTARNKGIARAKGKYLLFVDADDWIATNSLRGLIDYAEKLQLDFTGFGMVEVRQEAKKFSNVRHQPGQDAVVNALSFVSEYEAPHSLCVFLSLRSIWEENNIRVVEGITYEDYDVPLRLLKHCQRIGHYKGGDAIYYYRQHNESTVHTRVIREYEVNSLFTILDTLKKEFPPSKDSNSLNYWVNKYWVTTIRLLLLISLLKSNLTKEQRMYYYDALKRNRYFIEPWQRLRFIENRKSIIASYTIFRSPFLYKLLLSVTAPKSHSL